MPLLYAQRTAERRRHTECACYVDEAIVSARSLCPPTRRFFYTRSKLVSPEAGPRIYGRSRSAIAPSNVAGTLRVPSALLYAQRTAERRRHTEWL
jgi:hypothetical protein